MFIKILILINILFLLTTSSAHAQRSEINEGVELYQSEKFADAEVNFKKGKEIAPDQFEAHFNLGDAYYKQQRYEESLKEFYSSIELTEDPELKAKAYHNIGNSLLKSEKYKESIDAYKNALKINPDDTETKFNISYALQQLEKQQNQQQQNKQNQNQDQNKENEDQKNDQNQDQKNDQDDQQQNEQNKPDQNEQAQQDNTQNRQQPKDQISKEEAERILQALKNNEQDIQKKIRKKTGTVIKKEKDW